MAAGVQFDNDEQQLAMLLARQWQTEQLPAQFECSHDLEDCAAELRSLPAGAEVGQLATSVLGALVAQRASAEESAEELFTLLRCFRLGAESPGAFSDEERAALTARLLRLHARAGAA